MFREQTNHFSVVLERTIIKDLYTNMLVIYLLISNFLSMLQDLRRGAECSLLLLNDIILTIFLCIS